MESVCSDVMWPVLWCCVIVQARRRRQVELEEMRLKEIARKNQVCGFPLLIVTAADLNYPCLCRPPLCQPPFCQPPLCQPPLCQTLLCQPLILTPTHFLHFTCIWDLKCLSLMWWMEMRNHICSTSSDCLKSTLLVLVGGDKKQHLFHFQWL